MSRYYQGYQPAQRRQQDFSDIERMRLEQQQRNQQSQSQQGDNMNGMGKLAGMFKSGGEVIPSGGGQSYGGGNSAYGGFDMPTTTGGAEMPAGESWYSNLFSGGEGAAGGDSASAAMMNPAVAIPATALLAANVAHNKGISNWGDTLKGQLSGNTLDYYRNGDHGFMSKISGGSIGDFGKSVTDFATLDFGNGFDNAKSGLKNLFKLKLF
jgi:hypothetical protein